MGRKIAELSNENGKIILEDFAKLVFDKDSPDVVVKKFLEEAPKYAALQNGWRFMFTCAEEFNSSGMVDREHFFRKFLTSIETFKATLKEYNMDEHIQVPENFENIYQRYNSL